MKNLETIKSAIKAAFSHLCGLDLDHASTRNGIGWNGTHSRIASEAKYSIGTWSNGQYRYWAKALKIYHKQLEAAGFDMTALLWDDSAIKIISVENGAFCVKFENCEKAEFFLILNAVKAIAGRSWNGIHKCWLVPASQKNSIQSLATDYGFEFTEQATELLSQSEIETESKAETTILPSRIIKKLSNGNFRLDFGKSFDWSIVNAIKAVSSYRKYNTADKTWEVAPCAELLAIVERFGFAGDTETLREACGNIPASEEKIEQVIAQLTAEQESRFEAVSTKLLPYQLAPAKHLVAVLNTGNALDASDTGTGKTYVSLAACAVLGKPVYVVCPKPVRASWQRAANHFGLKIQICNYELLRRGTQSECPKVTTEIHGKVTEQFQWSLSADTIIIFDECHRLKDYKTLQSELGLAAIRQGYRVLGLSATAADNPLQMKFSGLLTGLFSQEKSFFDWALTHGVEKNQFGYAFNGSRSILKSIHSQIFPARGNRIRIADLGNAFPETQITAESYDLNGNTEALRRVYDDMERELAELEAREAGDKAGRGEHLVIRLRARQKSELLKVPAIAEMAKDAIESGMAVAIFLNFDESVKALCEKLKTDCVIKGGQSEAVRESNIAAFQSDASPVIVCNIKAGGVGVSLHGSPSAKTRFAIICPSDSGQDLKQALGRVHRAEGAKSLQRIFFAAGTIEETVCANVKAKIARIDALNDGDLAL